MRNHPHRMLPLILVLPLAGCSSTETLNIANEAKLCVSPDVLGVDYFQATDGKRYFAKVGAVSFSRASSPIDALPGLRDNGYAQDEATTLPNGFARTVDAYEVTDKLKPYVGEWERLCIGTMRATEIIDYTEPPAAGQHMLQARFKYMISYNDLIDDLDLEDALASGPIPRSWPGEGTAVYVKTNKGWRLEMSSWTGL